MKFLTKSLKLTCTAFGVHARERVYESLCGRRYTLSIPRHRSELMLNRVRRVI